MAWIEKIRSKSQEEKVRIIWVMVIVAAVILVLLWIITARFSRTLPKDTTLFDTLSKGIQDVKNNYRK